MDPDTISDMYKDYNTRLMWVSIGRPIEGTWKFFAENEIENEIFKELKKISKNYHRKGFDNAIKTMASKRILAFSLIIHSPSYIEGLLDCLICITEIIHKDSNKLIKIYENRRDREKSLYPNGHFC
jgi:hypothetical protein